MKSSRKTVGQIKLCSMGILWVYAVCCCCCCCCWNFFYGLLFPVQVSTTTCHWWLAECVTALSASYMCVSQSTDFFFFILFLIPKSYYYSHYYYPPPNYTLLQTDREQKRCTFYTFICQFRVVLNMFWCCKFSHRSKYNATLHVFVFFSSLSLYLCCLL